MQYVSSSEMAAIDELAINRYNISLLQMMEHAGWNLAKITMPYIKPDSSFIVLAGKGNNGGGGLCAARHLRNKGVNVSILLSQKDGNRKSVEHHLVTLQEMDVPIHVWRGDHQIGSNDVIIDALLGYNIKGDPRAPIDEMINWANKSGNPILSLDIPSGLNPDTGEPGDPCVKASLTLTLALPKTGFQVPVAKNFLGWFHVCDIGIPVELYHELGLDVGYMFNNEKIVRIL